MLAEMQQQRSLTSRFQVPKITHMLASHPQIYIYTTTTPQLPQLSPTPKNLPHQLFNSLQIYGPITLTAVASILTPPPTSTNGNAKGLDMVACIHIA